MNDKIGMIKLWDDSIFKEKVDNQQKTCNTTEGEKTFACDPYFKNSNGDCGIQWDCGVEEFVNKICKPISYISFATTIIDKYKLLWVVAMTVLTITITRDCC